MNIKDIDEILAFAQINYKEIGLPARFVGMKRDLTNGEIVAISYYKAVVQHLVKRGALGSDFEYDLEFINIDSEPEEDDYI